jgi:hypothetical protein
MDTSAPAPPPLACPQKLEVGSWFGRRATTPWSEKELKAWKTLHPESITEGIDILAGPYSAKEKFCRRDLLTLLNNWQGEIDRWRSYAPLLRSDVTTPAQSNYEDPPIVPDGGDSTTLGFSTSRMRAKHKHPVKFYPKP